MSSASRLPLLLVASALACGPPDAPDTPEVDEALAAPVVEGGGACAVEAGVVTPTTPAECEPAGNSAASTEIRRVPGLGFLDGVSCDAWPRYASYSAVQAVVAELPVNATTEAVRWLSARLGAIHASDAMVFGSNDRLDVLTIPWPYDGRASLAVAVDVARGYGAALDHHLRCTPQDEEALACTTRSRVVDGKPVQILVRSAPLDSLSTNILLNAPTIVVRQSMVLDVSLYLVADRLIGLPQPPPRDASGAPIGPSTGVELEAQPGGVTATGTWKQSLLAAPQHAGLVAFAREVAGFAKLSSQSLAPVHTLSLITPPAPLSTTTSLSGRAQSVALGAAVPQVVTWTAQASVVTEPLGNATLHKRMVVDSARVHLTAPPPVRGASAGSLTQVGAGDVLSPKPALQAQGVGPVAVSWTDAHVDAYAAAIAPLLFKPTGCGPVSPYPGHTTCRRYTACELGYPSCGQDPTLYEVCAQDFQQECHVRGGAQLATTWGVSQQWAASLTQGQLATRLATTVRDRLNLSYPRSLAPTRPPAGEVWLDSHPHGIALAAHVLSRGQYFRVLHAYAEEQSLRFGVPSTRWSTLAASISTDVLQGQTPEDLAISPAAWREAQTWDAYVRALYTPGAELSLNALSLPYGARAAGWHPTHVGAGSSGSVLDVLARWEGVAALVAQLDDVVDGQVELATIDTLIGAMTAQVTTTRDAAEVLGAAAADNAVAQQAALDQLTAVAGEVGTIQGSLESEIVRIWDCDDGFASCGVAFTVAAQALTASCPDGSSFASVLQTLSTITGGLSAVSAAAAVVGTLSTVQDAIDQAQQLASTGAADLARLRAGADTLRQVRRAIKSTTSGVKALASVVKTLRNLSDAAIADCEGTPVATQIQQLQTELALLEALSASLEAQLGVLDGLIASVTAHLTHLVTSAQALDRAAAGSDAVLEDLANVHGTVADTLGRQRRFIAAACQTTRVVTRGALVDLFEVGQTLWTAAGRSPTPAQLAVPRDPATLVGGQATDRREGFLFSLWDAPRYTQLLTATGEQLSTVFLDQARRRFDTHVAGELCRADGGPLPKQRWVVSKTLRGAALSAFLTTGVASFDVTLDDLVRGANASGSSLSAAFVTPGNGTPQPLSAPIVLGVGYAACTGPEPDPCCTGAACRRDLAIDAPYVVARQLVAPGLDCGEDAVRATASEPIPESPGVLSVCLDALHTPAAAAELPYVDLTLQDPALLEQQVEQPLCAVDPDTLAWLQVRGLPALGTWSVAHSGVAADAVVHALDGAIVPSPGAAWSAANGDVTALELRFFVGAEARGADLPPVYQLE